VGEGGATDTYSLALTGEPAANVTIELGNTDGQVTAEADADPGSTSLVFTRFNWATPQVVRVSAVDDNVAEGSHTGLITHTVSSGDADYNNLAVPDVTANVIDDDLSLLTILQSQGSTDVAEGGAGDSYTIALASQLASVVWVQFEDPAGQVVADSGGLISDMHEFTAANWSQPQTVQVTASNDSDPEGPHQSYIVHTVYDATDIFNLTVLGQSVLSVNVSDDDLRGVVIAETDGSTDVTEGGDTDTYTAVLTQPPTADVTLHLGTGDGQLTAVDDAHPDHAFLVFDTFNWDTPQAVRVTAFDDQTAEGPHTGRITHTATSGDGDYHGLSIADLTANVADNDSAGLTITETEGSTDVPT